MGLARGRKAIGGARHITSSGGRQQVGAAVAPAFARAAQAHQTATHSAAPPPYQPRGAGSFGNDTDTLDGSQGPGPQRYSPPIAKRRKCGGGGGGGFGGFGGGGGGEKIPWGPGAKPVMIHLVLSGITLIYLTVWMSLQFGWLRLFYISWDAIVQNTGWFYLIMSVVVLQTLIAMGVDFMLWRRLKHDDPPDTGGNAKVWMLFGGLWALLATVLCIAGLWIGFQSGQLIFYGSTSLWAIGLIFLVLSTGLAVWWWLLNKRYRGHDGGDDPES